METKERLKLAAMIIFIISSVLSAFTLAGEVRAVTIITLYASGFGAGATIISFLMERKMKNKSET